MFRFKAGETTENMILIVKLLYMIVIFHTNACIVTVFFAFIYIVLFSSHARHLIMQISFICY